jgi:hypothetical protein
MTVVNAIHALTETNLVDETGLGALTDVPYRKTFVDFDRTLSGTLQTTANSTTSVDSPHRQKSMRPVLSSIANRQSRHDQHHHQL